MLGDAPIDAVPKMQRLVMAEDEAGRLAALDELLPLHGERPLLFCESGRQILTPAAPSLR